MTDRHDNSSEEGFWFSYIDVFTVLAALFFILFIYLVAEKALYYPRMDDVRAENTALRDSLDEMSEFVEEARIRNRDMIEFSNAWDTAFDRLKALNAEPEVSFKEGGWRINVAERILFPVESDSLTRNGMLYITRIGEILNEFVLRSAQIKNTIRIVVGGHADTGGTDQLNFELSDRRAERVKEILEKKIPDVAMEAIGFGEKYPKATRQESRRITIVIQPISVQLLSRGQ